MARALFQKNTLLGNTIESLDGINGEARGEDPGGESISIQLGDRCSIVEDGIKYEYEYVDYSGIVDNVNYIRPVVNPDITKAWKLIINNVLLIDGVLCVEREV